MESWQAVNLELLKPEEREWRLRYESEDAPVCIAVKTLLSRLVGLREKERWIPVGEKLPNRDGAFSCGRISVSVLLFDSAHNHWIGSYNFEDGNWWVESGLNGEDREIVGHMKDMYGITHWRPLPAPPNGKEQG